MAFTKENLSAIFNEALAAENVSLKTTTATRILDRFLMNLENSIVKNPQGIRLGTLGKFKIVTRKQRYGMNLQTKERVIVPASNALVFKVNRTLKIRIKNSISE